MRVLKLFGYLLVLLLLLIVLALFFIDIIAKYVIEEEGTKAIKAKVELESVDVRYFPLGVSLFGLKVTNPQEPMTNAFEAGLIDANVAFQPLLKTKVIVESAALSGMRFMTPRQTSGAVPGLTPPPSSEPSVVDKLKQDFKLPAFELPDADQLLAQADLQTVKQAEELNDRIRAKEEEWRSRIDSLPDQAKLDEYKDRIRVLKETKDPFKKLAALKDVANIQKDVKRDLDQIKNAGKDLEQDIKSLKADVSNLSKAPAKDIDKMLGMVGLDANSVQGLAKGLFGDEVANWIGNGYSWYERLQPYLAGNQNAEPEAAAEPDTTDYSDGLPKFLVKTLTLDGELPVPGQSVAFTGEFTDLTNQAHIWGKPARLNLGGESEGAGKLSLSGLLDHVKPEQARDTLEFSLSQLPVSDIVFSSSENFPVTLSKALAVVSGKAEVADRNLDLLVDTRFVEMQMADLLSGDSAPLKQALIDALQGLETLDMSVAAKGAITDPDVSMSTSLDSILAQSMRGLVKKEQDKLTARLQTRLDKLVAEKTGDLNGQLNGLVDVQSLLGDRAGDFSKLL